MLTFKDQLAKKAYKIEEIKSTLKQSQLILMKQSSSNYSNQTKNTVHDQATVQPFSFDTY